ncbi:MAG TPA: ArsR family transcriptional regulator [Nitrospirae bacterium]|nr:ArsR family transcriptional regulator [Nitrospirota bacterium]
MVDEKKIYELQAEVVKALANPIRLEIIETLGDGEKCVGELVDILGVSKASISQHINIMRNANVLKSRRDRNNVYYSITNRKIIMAYTIIKEILLESLEDRYRLLQDSFFRLEPIKEVPI